MPCEWARDGGRRLQGHFELMDLIGLILGSAVAQAAWTGVP